MFDTLDRLEAEVAAAVAAADVRLGDMSDADGAGLGDVVLRFDRMVRRVEALRLRVSSAHAQSQAWRADGARTAAEWHRVRRQVTRGRAAAEQRTADALTDLPQVARQVADGVVSVDHAAVVARVVPDVPADRLDELDGLAAQAGPEMRTRQLRDAVTDFVHRVAPAAVAERERRAFESRDVRVGRRADGAGIWIEGRLDVIGGEAVVAALSALSAPRGEQDPRTAGQRRADALADLAERASRHDRDLPVDGGQRAHVGVVVSAETLAGAPHAPAARLAHQGPVSATTVRQLACDPALHRVISAGRSEVLDVGRSRVVSVAQRRALVARDGGCVGCGAPPAWTDAHHIRFWHDGGRTDLDNLVLVCRSCHTSVHHRDWTISVDDDGRRRALPPPRHNDATRGVDSAGGGDLPRGVDSAGGGDPPRGVDSAGGGDPLCDGPLPGQSSPADGRRPLTEELADA